jgi:CHAD domain-containing protein
MAQAREIEGLATDLPFAEAAALAVETRVAEVLDHSDSVLDTGRIEGVHDMRVATRRLRAALEVFAPCFPKKPYKDVLKEVKRIADGLGERRDRDVAIDALSTFAASLPAPDRPGIHSLIDRYADEQQEANRALEPMVDAERLRRLQGAVAGLVAEARALVAEEPGL